MGNSKKFLSHPELVHLVYTNVYSAHRRLPPNSQEPAGAGQLSATDRKPPTPGWRGMIFGQFRPWAGLSGKAAAPSGKTLSFAYCQRKQGATGEVEDIRQPLSNPAIGVRGTE